MRTLLPEPGDDLSDADLDAAYAWPSAGNWLRANMVSTVDGAARSPQGLSHGISSDADRRIFGRLRGLADVILAGASTVRDEGYGVAKAKPDFAARRVAASQTDVPAIAVVSRSLVLDLAGPLFSDASHRTLVITCSAADEAALARVRSHADVLVCGDDTVDLAEAARQLHARGLRRIHCEGGPHLLAGLAAAGVLDELLLTLSPQLAGGGYESGADIMRILAGPALADPPAPLRLRHVIEDAGTLFLSYAVASRIDGPDSPLGH
jgi:riboflavin biosynthesis pyrimidine reductase